MKEDNNNLKEEFRKINENAASLLKNYEILMMKTTGFTMENNNTDNMKEKDKKTIISKLNDFVEI